MRSRWGVLLVAAWALAGTAGAVEAKSPPRPPRAPAVRGGPWINSRPLTDADLRGHVVLVEFWTFGCINCQRTTPAMRALDAHWRDRGVIVLGIHRPEFRAERVPANVRAAVKQAGIAFPVCLDNDAALWKAFGVEAWPSLYLIDRSGVIRWQHVGEVHVGDARWTRLQEWLVTLTQAEPSPRQ